MTAQRVFERLWTYFAMAALLLAVPSGLNAVAETTGGNLNKVAFLGVQFQNDNEGLEPTSDAERARSKSIEDQFKAALENSGKYKFVAVTPEVAEKIKTGQTIGECNGCEVEFGKQLGADGIAWIKVQKVSNLILNMNVYMADVKTAKMTFLHSVDIRGNTDESWKRSLTYLLDNYFLKA